MEKECEINFMRYAIELAKKGEGFTNPNPLVGAVIVKNEKIIGEGFHRKYGGLHAEREAIRDALEKGNDISGSTIFVTLEPCCHYGKQPPCTQAILDAKIKRVVVGSQDPNPLVSGKGSDFLRKNGVQVDENFLRSECDELNSIFFHYISKQMPYIALKYAMTLDGKIATKTGDSKWITCEESRKYVHKLRNRYSSILVGIGTVLADDPLLNCRLEGECKNPVRIVCDSDLRISLESQIVKTAKEIQTIIVTRMNKEQSKCCDSLEGEKQNQHCYSEITGRNNTDRNAFFEKKRALENAGVEVVNMLDLKSLFEFLAERKIDSVLVEGGAEINYSVLQTGLVNHIYAFVGNKIFGGMAKNPVCGAGVDFVKDAYNFRLKTVRNFGDDVLMEYVR